MTAVPPLETARLLLPPFTLEEAHAVLNDSRVGRAWSPGYPTEGDREIAAMLLRGGPAPPDERAVIFGPRRIVLRASGLAVGGIGFFGPPDEAGTLSIGYGIAPEARNQGLTTEALGAMLAFAAAQPGVRRVLADTTPDNLASQRVLAKAGFQRIGQDAALIYYEYAIAR
ncbi:MAG TPA: GNAT family N-acetyltransferase [Thermomicrobiaceae bacterium]|nr:GNAT family N-acetyltransferase [Thermomicrobiaceae bacterium]